MRALPTTLLTLALLAFLPSPAAAEPDEPVECDIDDDLYNHCHAGPVHWVTGPGCVGVRYGEPAQCDAILPKE